MRIGILTQYYPPEMGAPQARLSEIAQRFVERGHEVYVLTAMPNYPTGKIYPGYGGFSRDEVMDGVRVIRAAIYPTKRVSMPARLASYFSFVISSTLVGAAKLPKLDFLITESPPLFLGIAGYVLSRMKRARWIFNVSDLWPQSAVDLGFISDGPALRAARALEAYCYRNADLVTGQSRGIIDSIRQRFPASATYHLSNGVDTDFFRPTGASATRRARLETEGHRCRAVYAGLHGVAQGLDQILAAADQLRDVEALELVLVGDGPDKERLVAAQRDRGLTNVRFQPPVPRSEMPNLLASADIALVPLRGTIQGAVPSKLYEAMAAGLPVILIANGEPAQIVREADCGIVVEPGDIDGLGRALRRLAGSESKRKQRGARGRKTAVAHFDRNEIARRFIAVLEGKPHTENPDRTRSEQLVFSDEG